MGGIILGVVPNAYVVLLVASLVYATGSTVTRVVLVEVGPATLALARLAIGALVLMPLARVLHRVEAPRAADLPEYPAPPGRAARRVVAG
jgi:threonine/homoserine efflux transporter RhtA